MSKLRIYSRILLATLLILLSGCKKKEETSNFTFTGASALHFNYGQTKEVGFTVHLITKVRLAEFPEGWDCRMSNSKVIITAPQQGAGVTKGEVVLSVTTANSSEWTRTIAVEIRLAEDITDHANCHIVTRPDTRYRFDGRIRGNEAAASIEPETAVLVWSTATDAVTHVSLEDGYVYFATADETLVEANALIAAMDGDNNILWSWHIWCIDYNPGSGYDELHGEKVMDRNLGAFANSNASSDEAFLSYGLYYQWGRKDPFVGVRAWDSSVQQKIYGPTSRQVTLAFKDSDETIGTVDYATAHPTHFILGTEGTSYDWLFAGRNNTLWGNANTSEGVASSKGVKSLYDPCPAGWMVAPPYIWASFTTTGQPSSDESEFNVTGEYAYGWVFDTTGGDIYYPAAGRRSFSKEDNFVNVTSPELAEKSPVGFYWSNSNASAVKGALLAFRSDYINPASRDHESADQGYAEGARAGGFPLRCVKEFE